MRAIDFLIEDPILQFMGMVILSIGIYDSFKFVLALVWKKIGGEGSLDD